MSAIQATRPDLSSRLTVARRLATEAGALALRLQPAGGGHLKGAQDWLTEADGAVERLLRDGLLGAFPDDGFVGEEEGGREGALTWVVDPIDGTSNFARGAARWCVSVALLEGDRPVLGLLEAPALQERWEAASGAGATCNGLALRAAPTARLDRAIVECGWSPRVAHPDYLALVGRVLEAGAMPRSGGSGALGLADVAAGRMDGYIERHINLWDCAAALVLLEEAGAWCSPFVAAHRATGGPLVAASPGVAGALAALL